MDEFDQAPPPQEQQLTHEDRAVLAIQRVETLVREALEHPNSETMDAQAKWGHPSWKTPILHEESRHAVGELEVTSRGLSDRPDTIGISLTRTIGSSSDTSHREEYWIAPRDSVLYKFSGTAGSTKDSERLSKCNPIDTKEVMDELGEIIEGSIHPEKQASRKRLHEIADASSPDKSIRRGGFLMRLAKKVFPRKGS